MTEKHRYLVQASFSWVVLKATTTGEHFYEHLFELDGSLRLFFMNNPKQKHFTLIHIICLLVNGLDDVRTRDELVKNLGDRYSKIGVEEIHYDMAGEALIWALSQVLSDKFTDEVREAWIEMIAMYACMMKAAHYQFEERRQMDFAARLYAA